MSASPLRVGWVGTGVMGASMCAHVMKLASTMTVYNRTRAKAKELLDEGAIWAESPKAVALQSDVVFTIVGFPEDVRAVYLEENGILAGVQEGSIVVDMTTTSPSLACQIHEVARSKGVHAIDAPVSGGDVGARKADLSIMVGGERPVVMRIMPLLKAMGRNVVYQGAAGAGQHTKMCNQVVIAGTMVGMCESLLYGYKAGLDLEAVLHSIAGGAAGCWSLSHLAPRIIKRDFEPGFFVDHSVKDLGIAMEEARRMNLSLPGLSLAYQIYLAVQSQGYGRKGTQALMLALEQMASVKADRDGAG